MLPFALTKKNTLLLFFLIVVIYIGITFFLYDNLESNVGEIVQHHTVHLVSFSFLLFFLNQTSRTVP